MLTLSRRLVGMSTRISTDQDADVTPLIRLLDTADALPGAATLRARSYDLLALPAGAAAVDVGCGTGRAVAELNERGMRAVGVDLDENMLSVARRRWPAVDFRVGDAYALPLPDSSMDGYRADKVYHELDSPGRALAEAWRVLTPGGRIVLLGQDWNSIVVDSDDPALARTIVRTRADTLANPWAARRYRHLLTAAGFGEVSVEVHMAVLTDRLMLPMPLGFAQAACDAGAISHEQAAWWAAEQTRRVDEGTFLLTFPIFVATAVRP